LQVQFQFHYWELMKKIAASYTYVGKSVIWEQEQ
jgi:hypothetical protein